MGYRIRVVPEVETWLAELRDSDPAAADLVDGALNLLREGGAGLGPPLVVPVDGPAQQRRPDLDDLYQRQLEALTRTRRGVAQVATGRKRLELQLWQLEQTAAKLADQVALAVEAGREDIAAQARSRASAVTERLGDLRQLYATAQSDENRAVAASTLLQAKVDDFRVRKEAIKLAEAVAEAVAAAARAEALMDEADPGPPIPASPPQVTGDSPAAPDLQELRPGAPERTSIRVLFAVQPPDTAVLLAAGTERDWLRAWYAEVILRCRDRYERDPGSTG